jgi:outer membrane protein assembly factor BamB
VEAVPCASDHDCKLNRLCDAGRCTWPATASRPLGSVSEGSTTSLPLPQYAVEPAQAMFRFGPTHRGRSPFTLPATKPAIWWAFQTGGPIISSPAIGGDGSVLVGSQDNRVYDVARDGTLNWSYATGDIIFSSPAVAHDGTVYIGSDDDHLYALTPPEGKPRWIVQLGACPQRVGVGPEASRCDVDGGPTIGPDGVIYTGGDGIYAINPDGTLRWHFLTNGHVSSAPALLPDGTVVAGSQDNVLYAVAPTGQKRWDFRAGADIEPAPAIGDDGTIYVGSDDHKLYAIGPDGVLRWAFTTGADVRSSVAIGNGIIYVGSFDAQLYAVHLDGTLAWSFRAGDRIVSSPLVDAAGAVLFGSQDDRLYCLEPDGHLRWSVELGGDIDSSPTLAADGTIFVGSDDHKLYALRAPSGLPPLGKP